MPTFWKNIPGSQRSPGKLPKPGRHSSWQRIVGSQEESEELEEERAKLCRPVAKVARHMSSSTRKGRPQEVEVGE